MGEREYFRIRTQARVGLRAVAPGDFERARLRVRSQHVPPAIPLGSLDESRQSAIERATLALLQRIWISIERIDRRLELIAAGPGAEGPWLMPPDESLQIGLSASGFAGSFDLSLATGELVEALLDLSDAGLPPIQVLARLARRFAHDDRDVLAFAFEWIHEADRERLVQLTLRRQAEALRARDAGRGEEE